MVIRWILPASLVTFFALAFVLPAWRRPEALVLHRAKRPVERVIAVAFAALLLAVGAWVALVAALGPAAAGVIAVPASRAFALAGEALVVAALVVVVAAQTAMGASFRIGIDARPTALVTRGPFALVRNPIFAALVVALIGVACATPSPTSGSIVVAAAFVVAIQVRLEEKHLLTLHGAAYRAYAARVGRFVPGVGLVRARHRRRSRRDQVLTSS